VKTLAVTSSKRSPALPDVPTLAEAAIPKFESVGWYGVLVPAGTPKDIVSRLNAELARVLALPDVNERLVSQGGEPTSSTPDQLAALLRSELRKWTTVIKTANIRVE
jgi:tripartite-type tricarboxylate transporter receptor subunit TctC